MTAQDGTGTQVGFAGVRGLAWGSAAQDLTFVTDTGNNLIRQFIPQTKTTTSWRVILTNPYALIVDSSFTYLYVTSLYNVVKINIASKVSTYLDTTTNGYVDGSITAAKFGGVNQGYIYGLGIDDSDNIYVADSGNKVFRTITPNGVYTFAGLVAQGGGYTDGFASTEAGFVRPLAITYVGNGYYNVVDYGEIRTIGPCKCKRCVLIVNNSDSITRFSSNRFTNAFSNILANWTTICATIIMSFFATIIAADNAVIATNFPAK